MKRLDYAKKHLQQTITALKRLHMLIYAVDQLTACTFEKPIPRFQEAAHLVDATRLLLKHFDNYQNITQIRRIQYTVMLQRKHLQDYIFEAFTLGTSLCPTRPASNPQEEDQAQPPPPPRSTSPRKKKPDRALTPLEAREMAARMLASPDPHHQSGDASDSDSEEGSDEESEEESDEEQVFELPVIALDCHSLSDACMVIDALGPETRAHLIQTFCENQLQPYQQLFQPRVGNNANKSSALLKRIQTTGAGSRAAYSVGDSESSEDPTSLDQVERRFAWYRRLAKSVEETFESVFPPHWKLQYELTAVFMKQTRDHLLALLQGPTKDKDSNNVTVLLKALQKSMLFEKEMMAWLQREYKVTFISNNPAGKAVASKTEEKLEFDESGKAVAADSAEGIKVKYMRQMKERQKKKEEAAAAEAANALASKNESFLDPSNLPMEPVSALLGAASGAFDNFMGPYIALEREQMDEQLAQAANDNAVDTRGELPVLVSSTNLFIYIKNSITRCTVLTRGKTFFLLYKAFCDKLRKYASVLAQKYPTPSAIASLGAATIGNLSIGAGGVVQTSSNASGMGYRIPTGEEITICYVIDTCEYCSDTVEALQDLIADKIDAKFRDQIDMTEEQDAFQDVTAKGIRILVSGLERRLENAYREMSSIGWATMSVVGEESVYVRTMHHEIQPFVESIQKRLPSSYFRSFCDKFALSFSNGYFEAIVRQKRISESGTQQLLLDVYNLKTLMLKLPLIGSKESSSAQDMYLNTVNKEFSRIELFLKLVGTRTELLTEMFKASWPSGTLTDLQTIMNLKGMKRSEQQAAAEKLGFASSSMATPDVSKLLSEKSSDVAAKVNSDLTQMRQKVDEFRLSFR